MSGAADAPSSAGYPAVPHLAFARSSHVPVHHINLGKGCDDALDRGEGDDRRHRRRYSRLRSAEAGAHRAFRQLTSRRARPSKAAALQTRPAARAARFIWGNNGRTLQSRRRRGPRLRPLPEGVLSRAPIVRREHGVHRSGGAQRRGSGRRAARGVGCLEGVEHALDK